VADGSPSEAAVRLLGRVGGKRLLQLGCADGEQTVAFALEGATVIGVDGSDDHIAKARAAAERAELRLELRAGDPADLAFLRADSVDMVFSDGALASLPDLGRLFRQVHRVLRHGAPFVFTLPHPVALATDAGADTTTVGRSYFDPAPTAGPDGERVTPHILSAVFTGLVRAGFRVDNLLEPEPPRTKNRRALLPTTMIWRARKEGS
jgi:SAM-dependent methyltransferase